MQQDSMMKGTRPQPASAATIVSRTDLNGVITQVNDAFVAISGFAREELVGRKHSIARHPEMPAVVFEDMWATIRANLPWQGTIKNRSKSGEPYWVKTLVVPVRSENRTVGYMAVSTRPAAEAIRATEQHYRDVGAKRARLKPFSIASLVAGFSFNARYALFVLWMAALVAAAGLSGLQGWSLPTAALIGLGLVSALGSYWFMSATVASPLKEAIGFFDQIAQGNLINEIPVNRPDEVGRVLAGLATAQTHLHVMIDEIRLSTEDMEQRCGQLEQQVGRVAELSRTQSDRADQIGAAMDGLAASVNGVVQTAETSAESVQATQVVVAEGNQRMTLSITATDRVATAVQSSGAEIDKLAQSIDRIGAMTGIVKEIADQTNLLALNAAIEAARAGEQGRGFAVVADEVRKLAERTTTTTADIDRMVIDIQATMRATAATMGDAVLQVREGRGLIEQTNESFTRITALSRKVADISHDIATAARQQSAATGETARNTEQILRLIEENGASFSLVGDAVQDLRQTADKLREVVAHFRHR